MSESGQGRCPLDLGAAGVAVLVTSLRLTLLERGLAFDELVEALRTKRCFVDRLGSPSAQARVAHRLVRVLPPWGMGACLKRSLVLLSLWSTHGLDPRLHLGVRQRDGGGLEGHAWLTVDDPLINRFAGSRAGAREAAVL